MAEGLDFLIPSLLFMKGALSEIFNYPRKFSNNTNLKGFRKNLLG